MRYAHAYAFHWFKETKVKWNVQSVLSLRWQHEFKCRQTVVLRRTSHSWNKEVSDWHAAPNHHHLSVFICNSILLPEAIAFVHHFMNSLAWYHSHRASRHLKSPTDVACTTQRGNMQPYNSCGSHSSCVAKTRFYQILKNDARPYLCFTGKKSPSCVVIVEIYLFILFQLLFSSTFHQVVTSVWPAPSLLKSEAQAYLWFQQNIQHKTRYTRAVRHAYSYTATGHETHDRMKILFALHPQTDNSTMKHLHRWSICARFASWLCAKRFKLYAKISRISYIWSRRKLSMHDWNSFHCPMPNWLFICFCECSLFISCVWQPSVWESKRDRERKTCPSIKRVMMESTSGTAMSADKTKGKK